MVQLDMTDDEAGILLNLIENHMPELEVEIDRTEEREFRRPWKKRKSSSMT